jgi:MoxR-like ATPase
VKFGASPRAALSLAAAAKARALLHGRPNASFEDVRALAPAVLRHRIILDYQARVEGRTPNSIIAALLEEIPFQADALPKTLRPAATPPAQP